MEQSVTFRPIEAGNSSILSAIRAIGLACLFSVPVAMLVIWPSAMPFLSGKTSAFRALAGTGALLALLYCIAKPVLIAPSGRLLAAFVVLMAISNVFGVNPARSFSGEQTRMEGFSAIATCLCYFFAVATLVSGNRLWKVFLAIWALSGFAAALSGLLQIWITLGKHADLPRIWGVMGHPVYLGIYLAFGTIFALWSRSLAKWKTSQIAWSLVAAMQIGVLCFTGTRSAGAGLIAAAMVAGISPHGRKTWGPVLAFGGMALAGAVFFGDHIFQTSDTLASRLSCWHSEWTFISFRPWFGWGQENLSVVCGRETTDRAHNLILQLLAWGGVASCAAYLAFLASTLRAAYRVKLNGAHFAIAGIVAYIVMMMFEPEALTTSAAFLTFAGWAVVNDPARGAA